MSPYPSPLSPLSKAFLPCSAGRLSVRAHLAGAETKAPWARRLPGGPRSVEQDGIRHGGKDLVLPPDWMD